jgi:hypothetical protein
MSLCAHDPSVNHWCAAKSSPKIIQQYQAAERNRDHVMSRQVDVPADEVLLEEDDVRLAILSGRTALLTVKLMALACSFAWCDAALFLPVDPPVSTRVALEARAHQRSKPCRPHLYNFSVVATP